jgi:hypothetical protein
VQIGGGAGPFIPPTLIRVIRLFRIVRVLRILRSAKGLRTIMMTVYISMPQLKNILLLILLIIVIVDMLCVNMFFAVNYTPGNFDLAPGHAASAARGEVRAADEDHFNGLDNWGEMVNRHANFGFFWVGFLTLIRASTGESFNGIVHDLCGYGWGHNRLTCCPQCGPILDGPAPHSLHVASTGETLVDRVAPMDSCGESSLAIAIYLFYQMIMAYIVLSIMIGVILENFSRVDADDRRISFDDIESFRAAWLKYDREGTFVIPAHNLLPLLQSVGPPLGYRGLEPAPTRVQVLKLLGELNIPDHGGYVHFTECLTAISYHVLGHVQLPECDTTTRLKRTVGLTPNIRKLETPTHNSLTNYLVSLLGTRVRAYLETHGPDADGPDGAAPPAVPMAAPADGGGAPRARVRAYESVAKLNAHTQL